MTKERYTEIASAVYDIVEFFPDDEPLKQKIKEKALQIMESLVLIFLSDNPSVNPKSASQALKDIDVLLSYLSLAKERGWVNNMNLMILFKEYEEIKGKLRPIAQDNAPVDNSVNKNKENVQLSSRQEKIIEILIRQEKVQVSDLQKALNNVSKRTLRRDLDELLKMGRVERFGEWNEIFYKLQKQTLSRDKSEENSQDIDGTGLLS